MVLSVARVQHMLMKTTQWQLAFLGHVLRRRSFENLVVNGRIEGSGAREHQRD